jgi:gluconate 2-dehydrogenase alpha chain
MSASGDGAGAPASSSGGGGVTLLKLNCHEGHTVAALFDQMFPADENSPSASEIGAVAYLDRALVGPYEDDVEDYRLGLAALDRAANTLRGANFADLSAEHQDEMVGKLERGELPDFRMPTQQHFFEKLHRHMREGLFADPAHGGNRQKRGWRFLGHPGIWLENFPEEMVSEEPVTKGGVYQSLEDLGYSLDGGPSAPVEIPGYDPQKGAEPPKGPVDVVIVGVGAAGGMVAPILARAGLSVVGIEAGPWRTRNDFVPDELTSTYYGRAELGPKFNSEVPRWRRNEGEPTREATFSLGRMNNNVGGSAVHYTAWLRRFHPYHFKHLTHVRENFGEQVLPEGHTLADWPLSYEELEPYYTKLDYLVGVSGGDEDNPFLRRSKPYPMPPLKPFRMGELFRKATKEMGLHPHMVPAGVNSVPYDGRPATTYPNCSSGFGSFNDDMWNPGLSSVPEALSTSNFELRTHCRVVRVLADGDGRTRGVEYVDANGTVHVQEARTIILSSYTFENVRLLLMSGDEKHPNGLGNNTGQVGKHFMTKMFSDQHGYFPDIYFNRHAGHASQAVVMDDFEAEGFDYEALRFVGGVSIGLQNEVLPISIGDIPVPPEVSRWGKEYKEHIRKWQHYAPIRILPDTLSYHSNFLELDPHHRDRSGLGLPVIRITYDMQENEHRLAKFAEDKSAEILRAMGATRTWHGARFTGVCSSHDVGGTRMGEDPSGAVVDADLQVHDTPGLYVFSGSTFPTCPGINPTHTIWAVSYRAAERLVERLKNGEE